MTFQGDYYSRPTTSKTFTGSYEKGFWISYGCANIQVPKKGIIPPSYMQFYAEVDPLGFLYYTSTSTTNARSRFVEVTDKYLKVPLAILHNLRITNRVSILGCCNRIEIWNPEDYKIWEEEMREKLQDEKEQEKLWNLLHHGSIDPMQIKKK